MADLPHNHTPRFHQWSFVVETDETALILPDGCMDVVVMTSHDNTPGLVRTTTWDKAPRPVDLRAGVTVTGVRLRPGITIDLRDIDTRPSYPAEWSAVIESAIRFDPEIAEIIDALSGFGHNVNGTAKQHGVSERTLHRHFRRRGLPSARFWHQLGRARRAVQALPNPVALTEIALDHGYCDQAHMTRDLVRWFGKTPTQLRETPDVLNILAQPGLGTWSS